MRYVDGLVRERAGSVYIAHRVMDNLKTKGFKKLALHFLPWDKAMFTNIFFVLVFSYPENL